MALPNCPGIRPDVLASQNCPGVSPGVLRRCRAVQAGVCPIVPGYFSQTQS